MKIKFLISLAILTAKLFSQNLDINATNYYDYLVNRNSNGFVNGKGEKVDLKGKMVATAHLLDYEATPVIIDELRKAGFENPFANSIVKIDSSHRIAVSAYVRQSKFGILFISGHFADPKKENRGKTFSRMIGFQSDYTQYEENINGDISHFEIKNLPSNIFWVCADWYWYQYSENLIDDKKLFSKEDAKRILREDIKAILKNVAKPLMQRTEPFFIIKKE